jgi:hypothetical protein
MQPTHPTGSDPTSTTGWNETTFAHRVERQSRRWAGGTADAVRAWHKHGYELIVIDISKLPETHSG